MKISLITATYDSEGTVRDTIESIKSQTYPNIEHIIVDGASKDKTLDIVGEYDHLSKIISEPDKGIYDAMNKGIAAATGDIVGILNSDDFYAHNEVIEMVVKRMEEDGAESLYGDLVFVKPDKTTEIVRYWKAKTQTLKGWERGWMPPHPTFFVRKEVYEKFGNFDLDLKSAADYEFMLRVLYKNKISTVYLPEVLVHMRTGGQSTANLKNRILANKEDKLAWEKNGLKPGFMTTYLKPVRKIKQLFRRPKN
jgi:glycosyltransferase involved in cell wall biosynthesis